jgi:pyruvate dehydrogenase E1 component alpha subunit
MGDPERYRKPEEVKKWQENDPIGIFRKYLLEKKTASAKALDEIDAQVEEEVNKAVEFGVLPRTGAGNYERLCGMRK